MRLVLSSENAGTILEERWEAFCNKLDNPVIKHKVSWSREQHPRIWVAWAMALPSQKHRQNETYVNTRHRNNGIRVIRECDHNR